MAYNLDQALAVAKHCAHAKRIAGLMADVPYSQHQLCEVIALFLDEFKRLEDAETLANRRYAAANAQMKRLAKKYNVQVEETAEE